MPLILTQIRRGPLYSRLVLYGSPCLLTDRGAENRITDIWMPGMDGFELAHGVLERHPSVKVLYVTGDKVAGERVRKENLPHLLKPFTLQELRATLNMLCCGAEQSSSLSPPLEEGWRTK